MFYFQNQVDPQKGASKVELGNGLSIQSISNATLTALGYDISRCACPTLGLFIDGLDRPLDMLEDRRDRVKQGKQSARDVLQETADRLRYAFESWDKIVPELKDTEVVPLQIKQLLGFVVQNLSANSEAHAAPAQYTLEAVAEELAKYSDTDGVKQLGDRLFRETLARGQHETSLQIEKIFKLDPSKVSERNTVLETAYLRELEVGGKRLDYQFIARMEHLRGTPKEEAARKQGMLQMLEERDYLAFRDLSNRPGPVDKEIRVKVLNVIKDHYQRIAKGPDSSDEGLTSWKNELNKLQDLRSVMFYLDDRWKELNDLGREALAIAMDRRLFETQGDGYVKFRDYLIMWGFDPQEYNQMLEKALPKK